MNISVVVATYNGEKYIIEQLETIRNQTIQPDEVIIRDDLSKDNTAILIQKYIIENNLTSWDFSVNKVNKGHRKNFIDAAESAKGDKIFFCDQDDLWFLDKIEKMLNIFISNKSITVVSCMTDSIDSNGTKIKNDFNKRRLKKNYNRIITFEEQLRDNVSPGLTLAIKQQTLQNYIPLIKKYDLQHDLPLGLFASVNCGYYIMNDILLLRRYHENNVSMPRISFVNRLNDIDFYLDGRKKRLSLHKSCFLEFGYKLDLKQKYNLNKLIGYEKKSIQSIEKKKLFYLVLQIFNINPMINKQIVGLNILVALFAKNKKR